MISPTLEERKQALRKYPHLVLFYLIPEEEVKVRNWHTFPRDPYLAVTNSYWLSQYRSNKFAMDLMDMWSFIMWSFLELRGGIQNFSSNDPMVKLIYDLDIWMLILLELGMTTDTLAELSSKKSGELPFLSEDNAGHNFMVLAKRFWEHPVLKADKIFEIVKSNRTHEDYSFWNSHVKIDFYRSYNRTQSGIKTISYDSVKNEAEKISFTDKDLENIEFNDSVKLFVKKLSGKHDQTILRLTYLGFTQKQIAEYLGYANHTAVSKRLAIIRKEYLKHYEKLDLPKPNKETIKKYT